MTFFETPERMKTLPDILREDCGNLGRPKIKYDPVRVIDKRTGKSVVRAVELHGARRRGRRG